MQAEVEQEEPRQGIDEAMDQLAWSIGQCACDSWIKPLSKEGDHVWCFQWRQVDHRPGPQAAHIEDCLVDAPSSARCETRNLLRPQRDRLGMTKPHRRLHIDVRPAARPVVVSCWWAKYRHVLPCCHRPRPHRRARGRSECKRSPKCETWDGQRHPRALKNSFQRGSDKCYCPQTLHTMNFHTNQHIAK